MKGPVLVLGDTLLDLDLAGRVERTTPDAGLPVFDVTAEVARPGGAGLAAALLAADGVAVVLGTAVCTDGSGARLRSLLAECGVTLVAGPGTDGTVVKTRLAGLARVDRGAGRPAPGFGDAVAGPLWAALRTAAAVLVSDYGRGVAADPVVRAVVAEALRAGLPVVWDPHPRGPAPVARVTLATPNLAEARAVAGSGAAAERVAHDVLRVWSPRAVAVTCGARGAVLAAPDETCAVAAPQVAGGDPCGAGDAFAGAVTAALADGRPPVDAVRCAVRRAARFVGEGGAGTFRPGRRPALTVD